MMREGGSGKRRSVKSRSKKGRLGKGGTYGESKREAGEEREGKGWGRWDGKGAERDRGGHLF